LCKPAESWLRHRCLIVAIEAIAAIVTIASIAAATGRAFSHGRALPAGVLSKASACRLVPAHGAASAMLIGAPMAGPRALAGRPHTFTAAADGAVALVWPTLLDRDTSAAFLFHEVRPSP
jgi:hypothetical protein